MRPFFITRMNQHSADVRVASDSIRPRDARIRYDMKTGTTPDGTRRKFFSSHMMEFSILCAVGSVLFLFFFYFGMF